MYNNNIICFKKVLIEFGFEQAMIFIGLEELFL